MCSQDHTEPDFKKATGNLAATWPWLPFSAPGTKKAWSRYNDGYVPFFCIVATKNSKVITKDGNKELGKGKRALDEWLKKEAAM